MEFFKQLKAVGNKLAAIETDHPELAQAMAKAAAGGVPFFQILVVALPFILQIVANPASAVTVIPQLIAAILALIHPQPAPTP